MRISLKHPRNVARGNFGTLMLSVGLPRLPVSPPRPSTRLPLSRVVALSNFRMLSRIDFVNAPGICLGPGRIFVVRSSGFSLSISNVHSLSLTQSRFLYVWMHVFRPPFEVRISTQSTEISST